MCGISEVYQRSRRGWKMMGNNIGLHLFSLPFPSLVFLREWTEFPILAPKDVPRHNSATKHS